MQRYLSMVALLIFRLMNCSIFIFSNYYSIFDNSILRLWIVIYAKIVNGNFPLWFCGCRPPCGAWFAAAYLATCHSLIGHHGIRVVLLKANPGSTRVIMKSDKNHFWLLFEGEKPAAWRRLYGRWRSAFGRLQSSGVGRWLSLQIWLEGHMGLEEEGGSEL